jgi:hypothetical protein
MSNNGTFFETLIEIKLNLEKKTRVKNIPFDRPPLNLPAGAVKF